ncbi:MAG: hypothetical protein ACRCUI_03495, partial [Polymorphobacter sp.]
MTIERIKLEALRADERARVKRRRGLYGDKRPGHVDEVGLALSGGGIRSATFSLGLMRELSRHRLFHKIDYLSTVSGGSYIGSFIGGLYARRDGADGLLVGGGGKDPDPLGTPEVRDALEALRESGNYLAPSGAGDYFYALTLLVRNWIGVHLVIGAALFMIALVPIMVRLEIGHFRIVQAFGHGDGVPALFGSAWLSPFVGLAALPALGSIIFSWAYWLTRREATNRWTPPVPALAGTALVIAVALTIGMLGRPQPLLAFGVAACGALAIAAWLYFTVARLRHAPPGERGQFLLARAWDLVRQDLTQWQVWFVRLALILLAIGMIDTAAFVAWDWLETHASEKGADASLFGVITASPFAVAVLVPLARWLLQQVGPVDPKSLLERLKALGLKLATAVVAAALIAIVILFWVVCAYAVSSRVLAGSLSGLPSGSAGFLWLCGVMLLLNLALGYVAAFLNLSSLSTFYAARLRRAYLGASNRNRLKIDEAGETQKIAVDHGEANDEIRIGDYYSADAAPLHLINITLNETQSAGSNLVQRERHGRNLVLSPAGIIYTKGAGDALQRTRITPAAFAGDEEIAALQALDTGFAGAEPGEPLSMSAWVAISGA